MTMPLPPIAYVAEKTISEIGLFIRIVDCFEQQHQYDKAADRAYNDLSKVNAAGCRGIPDKGPHAGASKALQSSYR
jgi:hypothetical protein